MILRTAVMQEVRIDLRLLSGIFLPFIAHAHPDKGHSLSHQSILSLDEKSAANYQRKRRKNEFDFIICLVAIVSVEHVYRCPENNYFFSFPLSLSLSVSVDSLGH